MEAILYVETNFVIGIAKGQDSEAESFLNSPPLPIRIAIPSVCFMEAFSVLTQESKSRKLFIGQMDPHIRDAGRDATSRHAKKLRLNLERARIEGEALLNDIRDRLHQVLGRLSAIADLIHPSPAILQDALTGKFIEDPTDNLILESILSHARTHPVEMPKAFLSGNTNDFAGSDEIANALSGAGVKYFSRTVAALGRLRSQLPPELPPR